MSERRKGGTIRSMSRQVALVLPKEGVHRPSVSATPTRIRTTSMAFPGSRYPRSISVIRQRDARFLSSILRKFKAPEAANLQDDQEMQVVQYILEHLEATFHLVRKFRISAQQVQQTGIYILQEAVYTDGEAAIIRLFKENVVNYLRTNFTFDAAIGSLSTIVIKAASSSSHKIDSSIIKKYLSDSSVFDNLPDNIRSLTMDVLTLIDKLGNKTELDSIVISDITKYADVTGVRSIVVPIVRAVLVSLPDLPGFPNPFGNIEKTIVLIDRIIQSQQLDYILAFVAVYALLTRIFYDTDVSFDKLEQALVTAFKNLVETIAIKQLKATIGKDQANIRVVSLVKQFFKDKVVAVIVFESFRTFLGIVYGSTTKDGGRWTVSA